MDKAKIIEFFDRAAPKWDAELIRSDEKINAILDSGGIKEGVCVLDVACGTGVLFDDYLKRGAAKVVGVDISPEMVKIARSKLADTRITVLCGDVQDMTFEEKFDAVMVYNAFPHFPEPERIIAHLAGCLRTGGRLTVAHGMSRAAIDAHHHGSASEVSVGLMSEDALAELLSPYFDVDVKISDEEKYIVSGAKRG